MADVNEGERWSASARRGRREQVRVVKESDALAEQIQGAVEAERAEILTLLQEMADAEPRMSEARITILMAAKRIHERGR